MIKYLTEEQIVMINKLIIQRYSPKEVAKVINPSALNMIVHLPEQFVFGKFYIHQFLIKQQLYLYN